MRTRALASLATWALPAVVLLAVGQATPAEAQSGEVTNVEMSIYNRTSIDVSWANTDQNVKHYIRWRSEYWDASRNLLTTAWENTGGSAGVELTAGRRTYRIHGSENTMYQVQIKRDGGQWMKHRVYVPGANDRPDPPWSERIAPGDERLVVSWLPSRGPTPSKYSIDWDWVYQGNRDNPRDSKVLVDGRELGINVRHTYTITGIPNGAIANVSITAVIYDWGETYTSREVRVTGVSPREAPVPSSDATLDDIIIFGVNRVYRYSPDFDSATTQYTVTVPRNVDHVIPIAYVNEVNATYAVEDAVGYGHPTLHHQAVPLAAPAVPKDIDIVVTAHDGVTTKTYTVTATRQGFTDATLKALTVSDGTNDVPLTPAFDSDTVSYTTSVEHGVSSVTVTPTVNEDHATVTVDGTAVPSGTASSAVSLTAGQANDIEVVVSAEDTSVTRTYTVSVTRAGSSDATLSALTISDGTLTPAFDSDTVSYTASVEHGVASVTVTPTVNESNAKVAVNGSGVISGSPSQTISLTVGQSIDVNVVVTAQDGVTTRTYTIGVTRAPVTVAFGSATYAVAESDDTTTTMVKENEATVTVTLSADPERTVTIPITTTNQGGATSADYSGVPSSVVFNSGDTSKTFTFSATSDDIDDDGESVKLTFGTLPAGVSPGSTDETTIAINDDDVPAATVAGVVLSTETLVVPEGGSATFTAAFTGDPGSDITVSLVNTQYFGQYGDPRAVWDMNAVTVSPDELTFTAGSSGDWATAQTVTVSAPEDDDSCSEQLVILLLVQTSPGSGDTSPDYEPVGGSSNAVVGVFVTVTDNDGGACGGI